MQQPPVPEPRDLLPPLLACLPTTFLSSHPPPALLPLLAPILRQRLTFLANNGGSSEDGWVKLLSWDAQQGAALPSVIAGLDLEPHPVSGEVELDDIRSTEYRRFDDETLHARLAVEQFDLLPIYVWCQNDEHGQTGPGWKLTELRVLNESVDGALWFNTIAEANEACTTVAETSVVPSRKPSVAGTVDDNDDSYWAAYDLTPAQTPAAAERRPTNAPAATRTEDDYYARYGNEVQPAMDAHDPDEAVAEIGESTLEGTQQRARRPVSLEVTAPSPSTDDVRPAWQKALYPHAPQARTAHDSAIASTLSQASPTELNMPRPISPASSTRSVENLERQAAAMSDDSSGSARFELGIKQHMSTEIKSLFRLAKTAGMSRNDFEQLVKRELDVLSMLDDE